MIAPSHSGKDHIDRSQSFWQLAFILSASLGAPTLVFGTQLGIEFGPGKAALSIIAGNLMLWIIGLAIVAMAYTEKKNAIENLIEYVGKFGSLVGGIVLLGAFLLWFPLQISGNLDELHQALQPLDVSRNYFMLWIGVISGVGVAVLSLGGIRLVKWVCVYSFPFLYIYITYAITRIENWPVFSGTWGFSFVAMAFAMSIFLSGTVNLPTFFRHSKSRHDAFAALTLMFFFYSFYEIVGVCFAAEGRGFQISSTFSPLLFALFIIVSLICANLVNIYFASAAWEVLFPKVRHSVACLVVSMIGTTLYVFIHSWDQMLSLANLFDSFIATLGVIVICAYLIKRVVHHRLRNYDRGLNFVCWIGGCIAAIFFQTTGLIGNKEFEQVKVLFYSVQVSTVSLLFILFIEETFWSLFKICKKEQIV